MKLGVALSGCGIGDLTMYTALCRMKECGIDFAHISVEKELAIPVLLFASACPPEIAEEILLKKYRASGRKWMFCHNYSWKRKFIKVTGKMGIHNLSDLTPTVSIVTETVKDHCVKAFSSMIEQKAGEEKWASFWEKEQGIFSIVHKLFPSLGHSCYQNPPAQMGYPTYPLKIDEVERVLCMRFTCAPKGGGLREENERLSKMVQGTILSDCNTQLGFYKSYLGNSPQDEIFDLKQLGRAQVDRNLLHLYDVLLF